MQTDSNGTILIIDDEAAVRQSIAAYLEDSDFEVLQASDGETGIEMYRSHHPDVVLCDLRMPTASGLDVLETVTREDSVTPVIVISGAGIMSDVVEALRLGASDYLIKPIGNMEVLEHAVRQAAEKSRLLRDNQRYREQLEESVRALEEDQQAGRRVQFKMFPESPVTYNRLQFSHRVIPSLYLSGDFVDYYRIDDRYIGFYLADVSGHGASSAFVTILLKNFVERLQRRYRNGQDQVIMSPCSTLKRINEELISLELGKHLAMFCGLIDLEDRQLKYSSGAHFPHPILLQNQEYELIDGKGLPVGIFPDAEYDEQVIDLEQSFRLVLFSDGIMEILKAGSLKDKELKLLEIVQNGSHTIDALGRVLNLDKAAEVPDDIAIMVVSGDI